MYFVITQKILRVDRKLNEKEIQEMVEKYSHDLHNNEKLVFIEFQYLKPHYLLLPLKNVVHLIAINEQKLRMQNAKHNICREFVVTLYRNQFA